MLEKGSPKSPADGSPPTPPNPSPEGVSGVGYAYNVTHGPPLPHGPAMHHPMYPPPWGPYNPTPHGHQAYSGDSNDSEAFMAHMTGIGLPPPNVQGLHGPTSFGGLNRRDIQSSKPYQDIDTRAASPPPTRERFSYTRYQVELLNGIFVMIRYPNSMQKQLIAKRVGIKRDQVKIWFQNRRRKEVVGKTTAKDDDAERTMVKDEVVDSVLSELQAFTNDPKGRKIKEAVRFSERKSKKRPTRNSSPPALENQDSKSPIHITPALDPIISEPYQPNCLNYMSHPLPNVPIPSSGMLGMAPLNNHIYPQQTVTMTTNALSKSCVSTSPSARPTAIVKSEPASILSSVLDSVPAPVAGQSTVKQVQESPNRSDMHQDSSHDDKESTEARAHAEQKTLTELTPVDESSNDSHYSAISSVHSEQSSTTSLHDSSGSKNTLVIDIVAKTPPTADSPNSSNGSLKRSRSDDSDEEEEPPKKRQETLADNSPDIVAPPNKVAPPSEPIKFDFSLMRPQMNQLPILPTDQKRPPSPVMLGPPQPWAGWLGRPGMPNPGGPTPDGEVSHFNPYMPPMNPHFKSPGGPELPWNPLREFYPMPPNFPGQPWDMSMHDPQGLDLKMPPIGEQVLNNFLPPDPLKMMGCGTQVDDGTRPGHMSMPPRPEALHSWMLPSYPNPYANYGAPPISAGGEKNP